MIPLPLFFRFNSRRRRGPSPQLRIASAAIALVALGVSGVQGSEEPASARHRFEAALEAAARAPAMASRRAEAHAERLAEVASRHPGAPTVEWQSEGFGFDVDREANGVDSLRLRREFVWPAQGRTARAFASAAGAAEVEFGAAGLLELGGRVGGVWLQLAALMDQRIVLALRADRLDRAVELHEKRFELGEVAGAEVTQLELQRARDEVERRNLLARSAALVAELRILTPTAPLPQAGDLGALLGEVRQVAAAPAPGGALVAAAEALATREQRLAEFEHRLAAGFPEGEIEVQRIPSVDGSESFESFGFRIAVPLAFSRSVAEKRAAAEARTEAARWRLEATRRDFEQRARAAHAALEVHEASLADLAPLLAQLPRTERSLAEQFRLGAISYLVYLDGLGRLDQLRLDLARTRSEAALARFELATLTADATIFPLAESAKAHSSALSPDASATETTP